jgi:peptide/nickel transport system substrate-binding protein
MRRPPTARATGGALLLSLGLALTGCASDSESAPEAEAEGTALSEGIRGDQDAGDPVSGGTLTFAGYGQPATLDPAATIAAATTGGIEMANLYDTLLRFDSAEQAFGPQLAEGIEADDEYDTFTLTLRDGVTFSNGDPLDADAVVWSQERYASKPAPEAALWNGNVESVSAADDRTVVYELARPWPGFPSILSTGPGMIVAEASTADGDDAFTPIGAGPFTLDRWAPDEEMVLAAREDYWDGAPHLEQVRSVYLNDQDTAMDSLRSGDLDAAFVRDPDIVDSVVQEGLPGYVNMVAAANIALINAAEGRPGADVRVRQAMSLAIDPELINQRAFEGFGIYGDQLFGDYSVWHTETDGPEHDPEQAKQLVEAAKADGWDGSIEYIDATDAASKATSLAVKASLEAVGMSVKIKPMRTIAEQISTIVIDRDYDVAAWGLNYREADPFSKMFATLHSAGTQVYGMHTSPEMDGMLEEFQSTPDRDEQVQVMDRIQQEYNDTVPFLNWGPFSEYIVWDTDVHGVVGTANSMVLLADAWIAP